MRNEWISAQDKLPQGIGIVLAWSTLDDEYAFASYRNNNWYCQGAYGVDYYTSTGISHWMELPEIPIRKKCNAKSISD